MKSMLMRSITCAKSSLCSVAYVLRRVTRDDRAFLMTLEAGSTARTISYASGDRSRLQQRAREPRSTSDSIHMALWPVLAWPHAGKPAGR